MPLTDTKPTLVFFKYRYPSTLPAFLLGHAEEHIKCLSWFFDVKVITEDCDYTQVCDKYQPDIALFESGLNISACRRLVITNSKAYSGIPKIGLINADAWCETRSGTLSEMEQWGIETLFAISTTAAEHAPEVADRLFIWPNFIDDEIYHDYGERKLIPVLLTGSMGPQYPWRHRVFKLVSKQYPSLSCPHHGYLTRPGEAQALYGESYARTISASRLAPTCGTVAKEVVRKHFEIPACNACLITQRSAALQAAGFEDMKNCVFADEHDVLDKLAYLFAHPETLQAITSAGHQLVHERHTLRQRDQLLQWLKLHITLQPHQRIIQPGPFSALRIADTASGLGHSHIISNGLHLVLMKQGDEKLWAGQFDEAEELYIRCLQYMRRLPEAHLKLALCFLYKGDARRAHDWICEPLQYSLAVYNAFAPDPVEWAYYVVTLLCLGRVRAAVARTKEFTWLRHPELDRARWATKILSCGRDCSVDESETRNHCSIHQLRERDIKAWAEHLSAMLTACGQLSLAEMLVRHASFGVPSPAIRRGGRIEARPSVEGKGDTGSGLEENRAGASSTVRLFRRRRLYLALKLRAKRTIGTMLRRLHGVSGYFMPNRWSGVGNDEFFRTIQSLVRVEKMNALLVVGAADGEGSTEAILAGALENATKPLVFCIARAKSRLTGPTAVRPRSPSVMWYDVCPGEESFAEELLKTIVLIKEKSRCPTFDAVLVSDRYARNLMPTALQSEMEKARFVFLDGISDGCSYQRYKELLESPNYVLLDRNPSLHHGYAIFENEHSGAHCVGFPC